jgi:hypothetical protein
MSHKLTFTYFVSRILDCFDNPLETIERVIPFVNLTECISDMHKVLQHVFGFDGIPTECFQGTKGIGLEVKNSQQSRSISTETGRPFQKGTTGGRMYCIDHGLDFGVLTKVFVGDNESYHRLDLELQPLNMRTNS